MSACPLSAVRCPVPLKPDTTRTAHGAPAVSGLQMACRLDDGFYLSLTRAADVFETLDQIRHEILAVLTAG